MNYELVKELKDAGFPYHWDKVANAEPPLGLLIEACGYPFRMKTRTTTRADIWVAGQQHAHTAYYEGVGATPEEAVARLWLAKNKK